MEQLIGMGRGERASLRASLRDWARRGMVALSRKADATRRARPHAQTLAAVEACAVEGASVEFATIELDGRQYGAVYVDGKLNCLLPDTGRL